MLEKQLPKVQVQPLNSIPYFKINQNQYFISKESKFASQAKYMSRNIEILLLRTIYICSKT